MTFYDLKQLRGLVEIASAAALAKLDALPERLQQVAPDLPPEAVLAVREAVGQIRAAWPSELPTRPALVARLRSHPAPKYLRQAVKALDRYARDPGVAPRLRVRQQQQRRPIQLTPRKPAGGPP